MAFPKQVSHRSTNRTPAPDGGSYGATGVGLNWAKKMGPRTRKKAGSSEKAPDGSAASKKPHGPTPAPPVLKKAAVEYKVDPDDEGADSVKFVYADAGKSDVNKDGKYDTVEAGAGVFSLSKRGQHGNVGGEYKTELLTTKLKASASEGGRSLEFKTAAVSKEWSVFVAPEGDNGKNPYLELGAGGDLLSAEVKVDALTGSDGKRVGFVGWAKAGAAVATGWLKGRIGIPLGKYSIDLKVSVSGDVGEVGGEIGGGAYYDKEEGRAHVIGGGAASFLGGLGLNFDLSVGKKF